MWAFGNSRWACTPVGIYRCHTTCGCCPTGRQGLQTFSNWLKKGKALFCTSHSSFWFTGEEVGLVSGLSLRPRFEGAEGIYWEQHPSCFPGLSQQSSKCGSVTLGLTGILLSSEADCVTNSSFLRGKKQSNYSHLHFCTDISLMKVKTQKECLGWLGSRTLNPLLSLLNFSGLKLVSSVLCNIHLFHPSVSLLEYLFWLRNKHFPSQNCSEQWCFIYK